MLSALESNYRLKFQRNRKRNRNLLKKFNYEICVVDVYEMWYKSPKSNPGKHKESLMRTHIKTCQKANGKPVGFKLTAYR